MQNINTNIKTIQERREILKNMIKSIKETTKSETQELRQKFRYLNLVHTMLKKYLMSEEQFLAAIQNNKKIIFEDNKTFENIILDNHIETKSLNVSKPYTIYEMKAINYFKSYFLIHKEL